MTAPRPLHQFDDAAQLAAARAAFVNAALEALAGEDRLDVAVAEVVRRSGWHNAAFYRVFGSKDALLLAVAEEAVARAAADLAKAVAKAATPVEAVEAWTAALLGRAAGAQAAAATRPFALDRHRLLHRFPEAEPHLTYPIRSILHGILRSAGVADAAAAGDAATELVMSQQATWLAVRHRPSQAEIERYGRFVRRLARLP